MSPFDVSRLRSLVPAAKQDDQGSAALHQVDPESRAIVDPKLAQASAYGAYVAEVPAGDVTVTFTTPVPAGLSA